MEDLLQRTEAEIRKTVFGPSKYNLIDGNIKMLKVALAKHGWKLKDEAMNGDRAMGGKGGSSQLAKRFHELNDSAAKELAGEVFYKVYKARRNLLERPSLSGTGGEKFPVHYDADYERDKYPFSKVLQIGPLIFFTLFAMKKKGEWTIQNDFTQYTTALGEVYQRNSGNIFFFNPSAYGFTSDMPLNPHAQDMIVQMLAERRTFQSAKKVIDFGAGDGLMARLALSLGAQQVFLIDNDSRSLERAAIYLDNDGFKKGIDYFIINADITDKKVMTRVIRQHHLADSDVTLINIGSYTQLYGKANEIALNWAMHLPSRLIINSGYRDIWEHEKEFAHAKALIREQGLYSVEAIRNGYEMGEMYGELTGTYTLVLKHNGKTAGKDILVPNGTTDNAQFSKGGIDLTSADMNLQTQNNGQAIKFHLDPAQLEQLQNAPGFVPVIINIQPMKDLKQFLGVTS